MSAREGFRLFCRFCQRGIDAWVLASTNCPVTLLSSSRLSFQMRSRLAWFLWHLGWGTVFLVLSHGRFSRRKLLIQRPREALDLGSCQCPVVIHTRTTASSHCIPSWVLGRLARRRVPGAVVVVPAPRRCEIREQLVKSARIPGHLGLCLRPVRVDSGLSASCDCIPAFTGLRDIQRRSFLRTGRLGRRPCS